MFDKLRKASGKQFNRLYMKMQQDAHDEAVKLFTSYSKKGDNADLKTFAAETLPTLQQHRKPINGMSISQIADCGFSAPFGTLLEASIGALNEDGDALAPFPRVAGGIDFQWRLLLRAADGMSAARRDHAVRSSGNVVSDG